MSEIIIKLPGADAPGFLHRVRKSKTIMDQFGLAKNAGEICDVWEAVATYLIAEGYVTAPDGVDVQEALAEMSQNDLRNVMWALAGIAVDLEKPVSAVDPQNAA